MASTNRSNRLTGTKRPTASTNGSPSRTPPGENRASIPGGTTVIRFAEKCSRRTRSSRAESDSVTIWLRR